MQEKSSPKSKPSLQQRAVAASSAGQERHRQDRVGRRRAREERRRRFAEVYSDLPVRDLGDFTKMQTFDTSQGVLEKDAVTYTVKVVYLSVKGEIDTNDDGAKDSVLLDTTGDGHVNTVGKAIDTSGDGKADTVGLDTNGDGSIDTYVKLTIGSSATGEFNVRIRKAAPNVLQLLAPSREQLSLDMLVDAVESYFDELVAYQAKTQSTVTDADFEVTAVTIGATSGVRTRVAVDTSGDGRPDTDSESWLMPNTLSFSTTLYKASDKVVITGVSKYIVGMPVHQKDEDNSNGCCTIL